MAPSSCDHWPLFALSLLSCWWWSPEVCGVKTHRWLGICRAGDFKVHGLWAYTPGTTSSYPGPACCVGPEFTERYLEFVEKGTLSHLGRERGQVNEWYQRRSLHDGNKLRTYNSGASSVKHGARASAETERSDQIWEQKRQGNNHCGEGQRELSKAVFFNKPVVRGPEINTLK